MFKTLKHAFRSINARVSVGLNNGLGMFTPMFIMFNQLRHVFRDKVFCYDILSDSVRMRVYFGTLTQMFRYDYKYISVHLRIWFGYIALVFRYVFRI